jgi:MYXO-CTERM domain-containing protein
MSFRTSLLAAAATMILGTSGAVQAQTCASDKDCPQGYACHSENVAVPQPTCKPGTDCMLPDASETTTVVSFCQPKGCSTDADCGTGMVCNSQTSTACSGGSAVAPPGCAANQACPDAGPPPKAPDEMCTTTTVKACAFKWQLPCNMDSDCGAGFTCKPTVSGSCSGTGSAPGGMTSGGSTGSAGTARPGFAPPGDAGMATPPPPPPPPPTCTTTSSFPGYCQPLATTCTMDSDCPANWKCSQAYDTPVSTTPAPAGGAAAIPQPATMDAGAPPPKSCVSAFAPPIYGGKDEAGRPVPGMGTSGGNGGPGGGSTSPIPPPADHAGADAGAGTTPSKSSGCAMGAGAGSSGLGLALVALVGFVARRRRR